MQVWAWGESGNSGSSVGGTHAGAGSGAGAVGGEPALGGLVPGSTVLTVTIGTGGTGTDTTVTGGSVTVTGAHGQSGSGITPGSGGAAGTNTVAYAGGNGAAPPGSSGGGGGGSAGSTGAGGPGSGAAGGAAGTGAAGPPSLAGVARGAGGLAGAQGTAGTAPGGGAGGPGNSATRSANPGAPGQVIIIWSVITISPAGYAGFSGVVATAKQAVTAVKGYLGFAGGPPRVVNQWSGTFAQPSSFGPMPPALQSTVIALTPASLVGGGTGYPSAGNWLFAIAGWNQSGLTPVTFGAADDIHSFWRPGDVTASNWAVSPLAGNTRTSIWYTANLARQPGDEYAAPSGVMAGMAVTVIEVAGLGPWDTVTGIFANYAAAAESLNLALAAPASTAFLLAAACGDSSAAGQALAPAGWAPLHAVTASNGTDHTCDAVLTAAVITTTGSVSVNATASSPTDLSGVIIGVQVNAPSPIGAGANPAWPGRLICEAAFGSGYETPPDEMMWTPLTDTQWPSPWNGSSAQFKRAWAWSDRSGIPWGLGQYQSAAGAVTWDNSDGWLTPANVGSGFYFSPAALNVNPSFQPGVYPWTATGGAALAQSSAQVFATADSGLPQYSAMITPNGTTANPGAISEKKAVSAGSPYTDSAWFWSAAAWAAGAQVVISWYNSGGSLISASSSATVPVPAAAWTQVTLLDQAAPAGAVTAAVTVQFAGTPPASQVFWVAEAVLVPGASLPQTGCVTAGTPVRLRMALGTITGPSGTVTYNRWYCWQRNAQSWPETRKPSLRNLVQASLSEVWQSAPGICPTPYRGEVAADSPGWWWPCDDQPLSGGVLPTSLRNAATGSSAVLNIVPSPAGVTAQDAYCSGIGAGAGGTDITTSLSSGFAEPSVATYNVGQLAGWMYGDPQVSPASAQSGNPVTAQPGSAAWQQSGGQGNTGSNGFVLIANDNFPPIASGVTVTGWFRAGFLGTASSVGTEGIGYYNVAGQPYAPMTLAALYTNTGPVALLQLATTTGHLTLTTYNGGTPATVTIYSASDLRCNASFRVTLKLTQATYAVLVNGGLTASASGSCTISASAWQWLLANGDLGTNGGSLAATGLVHGGNLAVSHLKVFTGLLPAYRELAQYSAAITGCGVLPAPSSVAAAQVLNEFASGMTPDGTEYQGSYGSGGGTYGLSALAASVAGSYTSGTGARSACAGKGYSDPSYGAAVSVTWAALAPLVNVYTASGAGTETEASACLGAGDSFTGGYGASASGHGVSHVSSGTGASPPSGPSALGDTVGQRIERALGYAKITVPMRAVDQPAELVKAALDVGGAQCGASVQNIVSSDNGWFFTDLNGVMCYRDRAHLNSDTVAWHIGMNVAAGQKPFAGDVNWDNSPERAFTAITVQPYSPDGATLAELVPSDFAAVDAAQAQYGPRPLNVNSYLQSTSSQQSQADFLFSYYGTVRRRGAVITINAASHPAAWALVLNANLGDLVQVYDAPLGSPPMTVTYRISYATRQMSFGADGQPPVAKVTLVLDPVPPAGYWS